MMRSELFLGRPFGVVDDDELGLAFFRLELQAGLFDESGEHVGTGLLVELEMQVVPPGESGPVGDRRPYGRIAGDARRDLRYGEPGVRDVAVAASNAAAGRGTRRVIRAFFEAGPEFSVLVRDDERMFASRLRDAPSIESGLRSDSRIAITGAQRLRFVQTRPPRNFRDDAFAVGRDPVRPPTIWEPVDPHARANQRPERHVRQLDPSAGRTREFCGRVDALVLA